MCVNLKLVDTALYLHRHLMVWSNCIPPFGVVRLPPEKPHMQAWLGGTNRRSLEPGKQSLQPRHSRLPVLKTHIKRYIRRQLKSFR